jgi:hypothetical protein
VIDVDPAVKDGSLPELFRSKAIAIERIGEVIVFTGELGIHRKEAADLAAEGHSIRIIRETEFKALVRSAKT